MAFPLIHSFKLADSWGYLKKACPRMTGHWPNGQQQAFVQYWPIIKEAVGHKKTSEAEKVR